MDLEGVEGEDVREIVMRITSKTRKLFNPVGNGQDKLPPKGLGHGNGQS